MGVPVGVPTGDKSYIGANRSHVCVPLPVNMHAQGCLFMCAHMGMHGGLCMPRCRHTCMNESLSAWDMYIFAHLHGYMCNGQMYMFL